MRVWARWMIVGVAAAGCDASDPAPAIPLAHTAQAIQDGQVDTTDTFAVGICRGSPGSCTTLCSGTLILPNVVATARHCVSNSPDIVDCSADLSFGARKSGPFNVTTNVNALATSPGNPGWYAVKSIETPSDNHICGNDIALLVLSLPVPEKVAKPVIPGVQHVMWDPELYRSSFTAIGYGSTSPSGGGSGTRRIRTSIPVLCIPNSEDEPCPDFVNPKEFIGGDGTCPGDSGSSAFETRSFNLGAPVAFGVLSRGNESDDGKTCVGSAYTRFDAHRDFVLGVARAASNEWQLYPEPAWTAFVPPLQATPKTTTADAAATPIAKAGFATRCGSADDCSSGICTDDGQGVSICSATCTTADTCTAGFDCRGNLCLPPLPGASNADGAATKSGCSVGASGTSGLWPLLALAALATFRKRKERRGATH